MYLVARTMESAFVQNTEEFTQAACINGEKKTKTNECFRLSPVPNMTKILGKVDIGRGTLVLALGGSTGVSQGNALARDVLASASVFVVLQ